MKRILIFLFTLTFLPAWLCAQAPARKTPATKKGPGPVQAGLNLKVRIRGINPGQKCVLGNHYGDKQYVQDTAVVGPDGWMTFKRDTMMPGGIYLVIIPSKKYFEIVLADDQQFSAETDTLDFVKNMKITGCDENKFFYEYLNYLGDMGKKMDPLQDAMKRARASNNKDSIDLLTKQMTAIDSTVKAYKRDYYKTKHPKTFMAKVLSAMDEPDALPKDPAKYPNDSLYSVANYWHYRNHYFDGMDFSDDRLVRSPVYANKLKFYLDKIIPQNPDSIAAACDWIIGKSRASKELFKYTLYYCTYHYESSNIMGYDAIFVHVALKYYKTHEAWWVSDEQNDKIVKKAEQESWGLIGKPAINLMMEDSSGNVQSLQAVDAKYTVVIFWDPTCSHCKKEVPILQAYADSLNKAGTSIKVYAVYSELDYKAWKDYIKEHKLNWINVCAKNETELGTAKYYYEVNSTPTIFLLDRNKKIIAKRLDADGLKGFLNRMIRQGK